MPLITVTYSTSREKPALKSEIAAAVSLSGLGMWQHYRGFAGTRRNYDKTKAELESLERSGRPADFEAAKVSIAQATRQAMHGMWRGRGARLPLLEASGQSARAPAQKARTQAPLLRHLELQTASRPSRSRAWRGLGVRLMPP